MIENKVVILDSTKGVHGIIRRSKDSDKAIKMSQVDSFSRFKQGSKLIKYLI
jgi:hypothetical protein